MFMIFGVYYFIMVFIIMKLLCKILELYMLQDKSDEFENTWSFLDRRFANIRNTGNFLQSVSVLYLHICFV